MKNKQTTIIYYQVCAFNSIKDGKCSSLKEAIRKAKELKNISQKTSIVEIYRYDYSGHSNYYELVKTV